MPRQERDDIWFDSADGKNQVAAHLWHNPNTPPFCVVQISHGMCEYAGRYDDFARFLVDNGAAVYGNDHLGHGHTAKSPEALGHFTTRGGHRHVLQDLKTMNGLARQRFPGVPLVLLGHSMGSFYARRYAAEWPKTIDGLVLSGTAGPNPLAGLGIAVARLIEAVKGSYHRSNLLHAMAFGSYFKRIPNPKTPHDWVSRDAEIVAHYAADPYCDFRFTVNGFGELFTILRSVSSPKWARRVPRDLPVLMIQGGDDPVGAYDKGTAKVRGWLQNAGVKDLTYKLYPGARHEVLNETNRAEVYRDVLHFLQAHWQTKSMG